MFTPLLTEPDPISSSEGSLDPLGMYAIADSLALRLAPGVRERQSHPRFLTAIAVSIAVCSNFDEDMVASDGVSEPWQVFEWYVVEGLVRRMTDSKSLTGLPGREKVAAAINDGVPISAPRYLKNPSVFGFHGVYRVLSRELGVQMSGRLAETGYDLLLKWMKERGLEGFYGSYQGPGTARRNQLVAAVKDGLELGAVARSSGWSGWSFFSEHMAHLEIGSKEAAVIRNALLSQNGGQRQSVIDFLVSREGKALWSESESERLFHKSMATKSESILKAIIAVVMKYESFSRLLEDAFNDCLFRMSQTRAKTKTKEFVSLPGVKLAADRVPQLYGELVETLAPFGETLRFQDGFSGVSEKMPVSGWVECLLEHHRKVQRNKLPNGKAPWFERFDDGTYMIRPAYLRSKGGFYNDNYVHQYRTRPLWSFATDLKMVS